MARLSRLKKAQMAKEAKQKKLLLVLAPVLLALLVWQGPKTYKAVTGGAPPAEPAATQPAVPTPTDPVAPAQPAPAASSGLADTDPLPVVENGELISFDRFESKDPFVQQVGAPSSADTSTTTDTTSTGSTSTTPTTDASESRSLAELSVNGERETVRVGKSFPAGDPIFRLSSIGPRTVRVGLVGGSFSGGRKTVEITIGESVVLLSEDDGVAYRLKIIAVF